MKKKILSLILATLMCVSLITPAFADASPTLESLAEQYVTKTSENSKVVYGNLQSFYAAVHNELPDISDMELASFIFLYMQPGEYDLLCGLSEYSILEYLTYHSFSKETAVLQIDSNGNISPLAIPDFQQFPDPTNLLSPMGISTTNDGYLQFNTTKAQGALTSNGRRYTLTAKATWLQYPINRHSDTLAIVYGGTADDSIVWEGQHYQKSICSHCGSNKIVNENISYGPIVVGGPPTDIETSDVLHFDYEQNSAIGIKCDLQTLQCKHTVNKNEQDYAEETSLYSYLKIAVLVENTTETRTAYAHTYISLDVDISGSISDGSVSPSFSPDLLVNMKKYTAPPLTLTVN